jgi:hypothetical protein
MRTLPSRSLRKLAVTGLWIGALVGCRSRAAERAFLATRVPVARLDSVLHAADSVTLPLADARTLFGVTAESGFAAAMPHDTMTVGEILAWGRAERARKQQADAAASTEAQARRAERKQQLDSLLAVSLVNKSFLAKDPDVERYEDYISLTFAYHNKGTRAVRAFQGDVTFLDTFGDTIYSAHLKVEAALAPGQTRREGGRVVRYNPFRTAHQRLRDTPLSALKVLWETTDVVFGDGTRLSLDSEQPAAR